MSDRGRPHNLGQALFESLGAGLKAYGIGLEQERIRKSETQQQTFLNSLRTAAAKRQQGLFDQQQTTFNQEQTDRAAIQDDPTLSRLNQLRGAGVNTQSFFPAQNISDISTAESLGLSQATSVPRIMELNELAGLDRRERLANIESTEALALQRGRSNTGGAGRSMFGTGVGSTIFNQLNLGFQLREFNRLVAKGDPQFATPDPETDGFLPRQDVDVGMIATPEDTLRVLLQKAKRITGEAPTTTLQELGKESVFPQPTFGLPPMIAASDNEWGRANIDDWDSIDDKTRVRILELARSQGALQ